MTGRTGARGAEFARKALHLLAAALPILWAAESVSRDQVLVGVTLLALAALTLEGARFYFPSVQRAVEHLAGPLLRANERRALTGATWLALGMLLAVIAFPPRAAICALWAVVVGDAVAAIVGQVVRWPTAEREGKTISGSLACFAASAGGAWWLAAATPLTALLIGGAAAAAERIGTRIDDNVRVAAVAGLAAWALGVA